MSGVWIRTGTIGITHGSHTVTGSGTAWLSGVNKITAGSTFWLNNVAYEIARVNADTSLELVDVYDGNDITGSTYRIQICLTDSVPELALRIAAALSYWNTESTTYLAKGDNLASLADVAMGRRNLGMSAADAVSFKSVAVSDVSQTRVNLGLDTGNDVSFKTVRVSDPATTRTGLGLGTEQEVIFKSLLLNGQLSVKSAAVFNDAVSIAKLATFSAGVNILGPVGVLGPVQFSDSVTFGTSLVCNGQITVAGDVVSSSILECASGYVKSNNGSRIGLQGLHLLWNEGGNNGAASLVCNRGAGTGGFVFRVVNTGNTAELAKWTFSGTSNDLVFPKGNLQLNGGGTLLTVNGRVKTFTAIGSNASGAYLELVVDGSAYGINMFNSDQRLKHDISESQISAVARITQLRFKSFKWNNGDYVVDCGLIAQDLKEQFGDQYIAGPGVDDEDKGYLQLGLANLMTLALKAIQEQQAQIAALELSISLLNPSSSPSNTQ